jgi:Ca-activated chloride channel homolog
MRGGLMGISNLMGLLGLIGIPIIVILYMLRPKNKPLNIPSLYLWQSLKEEIESASQFKKLKSSLLMFIQIVIVLLMTAILSGIFIKDKSTSDKVLLIVDCSYTMASTDVEGNRLELAKSLVENYVKSLDQGTQISLMALEEVPRMLITKEVDRELILNAVNNLQVIDGIADLSIAKETIQLIRDGGEDVVYFGDRFLEGAQQYTTASNQKNYSIHQLTYTKYLELGTLSVLTHVYNQDEKVSTIPLSLYVDGTFFGAKQVTIEGKDKGVVYFEDIPLQAKELKIQLDVNDNLSIDNEAYGLVSQDKIKKALLVSSSNIFLEKVLRLHPNIELSVAAYEVDQASGNEISRKYSGYDLYIFDRIFPKELPTDGALLLFDPIDRMEIKSSGYVEMPKFATNNHPITQHIEETEFNVRIATIFSGIEVKDIIYSTEFGPTAFTTFIQDQKSAIFGFSLQDTDLPLSIEFPVLMMNTIDYLITNRLVENPNMLIGEHVKISILPSVTEATVTTPKGEKILLSTSKKEFIFTETNHVGQYVVEEITPTGLIQETFVMNVPRISENRVTLSDENQRADIFLAKRLDVFLGVLILSFMMMEWLIYSYRRKIYGNTF